MGSELEHTRELFSRAKAKVDRGFIEREFAADDAKWMDGNYQTVSPLRADAHSGSFSIREDGVYFDRATGESGDIIDLFAKMHSMTPMEAASAILGEEYVPSVRTYEEKEEVPKEPVLSWVPIPEGKTPKFGTKPDYLTMYHVDGLPAFYIARYNARGEEKKLIYPLFWTGSTFKKGFPEDLKKRRPLLDFDRNKTVVIVEGEKCAHEGADAFPQYSWTCWHGGATNVAKVDYNPLAGCDVVIWPDLDTPGEQAGDYLCNRLAPLAGTLRRVVPPLGKAKGWDVADAIAEKYPVLELLTDAVIIDKGDVVVDPDTLVEPRAPAKRLFTDLGNAERFLDMWGHVLRYNVDKNKWMVWHQGRWKDSDQTVITPMIKRTIRGIATETNEKTALFWARKSESARGIQAMVNLAKNEVGVPVKETDLDQHLYYLNCPNGVVDLRSGELMDAKPEFLCYKVTNTAFCQTAQCPTFLRFLDETFEEDGAVINFLQRWIGYSLTSDVSAQTFAVFYGIGANGKSTLVETIQRVAGDYVKTAPPDTFIQKQAGGIPNDIAALRGARMVLTTETEANARLAEAKVKSMTGGDRVSARYMRGEFFEFTPTWKITISTNHRPRISGGDYGIWRRVVLVPFNNVVTPDRQDPLLPNKLLAEADGILAWAVRGAVNWYQSNGGRLGLQVPESVYAETQEYREDEDIIGRFLSTGCLSPAEVQDKFNRKDLIRTASPCTHVYYSFRAWAEHEGEGGYAKMSQNMFSRAMRERGYSPDRSSLGRFYEGVVPKPEFLRYSEYGTSQNDRED